MPFCYKSSNFPCLRQGEIINNLVELNPTMDSEEFLEVQQSSPMLKIIHPYAIVVSQDCDLDWDYKARNGEASKDKLLTHVLFCKLFSHEEIRFERENMNAKIFSFVKSNQHERYHCLETAPVSESQESLPELYADFKATFSLPVDFAYWLTSSRTAIRIGCLPSPYLEDFMHRLYSFLGRVAVP